MEALTRAEEEVFERAIVKLVFLGKQVGIDAAQMIAVLESGCDIVELAAYMASRTRQCRCE